MAGKEKSTSNTVQTNNAYAPVKPVIDQGAGIMRDYLSNPNSTAVYGGQRVADLSGDTQAGLDLMRGSAGANKAFDYYSGMIGSGAGGMNPQVQAMQDAIKRQIQATTNAQFSNAGTVGGTAHQESLAKGLADGLAQPLFNAYESDMARKMAAAQGIQSADQTRIGNMTDAGQIMDSYNQSKINADMGKFEEQRTAPIRAWSEVAPLATQIGSAFGTQQGTSTQTSKTPLAQQIAGGAMMGIGALSGFPGLGMMGASAPWVRPSTPYAQNSAFNLNALYR